MLVRAFSRCEGYFIRIDAWKRIMRKYPNFVHDINYRAIKQYETIWTECNRVKQLEKKKMLKRRDFKHIIMLDDQDTIIELNSYLQKAVLSKKLSKDFQHAKRKVHIHGAKYQDKDLEDLQVFEA